MILLPYLMANLWHLILFFIGALILLLSVSFWLVKSLKSKNLPNESGHLNVYKSQLEIINAEYAAKNISDSEYEGAKIEIGKRLNSLKSISSKEITYLNPKASFIFILIFGFLSIGIYYFIGSPFYADLPFNQRSTQILNRPLEQLTSDEIMILLQDRASKNPQDFMPHLLLGKVLISEEKNDDALRAFQASLRRNNKSAETYAEIAGTLFKLNGGNIDEDVTHAINTALKLEPENLTANFYNGQFLWKTGKKQEAINLWANIYKTNANLDKPNFIGKILDEMSQLDVNKDNVKALSQNMNLEKGGAPFIESMIGARETRLLQNPKDLGLILSVARVKIMMNKVPAAKKILENGKNQFPASSFEAILLENAINAISDIGQK